MSPSSGDLTKLNDQNPWPGLAAYDETSSDFFFGRGEEAAEVFRLIRLAPLTVVYGKSGLGKTSLLQAGLYPLLRCGHYLPVHLRIDFSVAANLPPFQQVIQRLKEELDRARADYPAPGHDEDLWEYLHRKDLEVWSQDNFLLTPVLVFDQFEELFSRGGSNIELIQQVFDGLADLIENRIPAEIASDVPGPRRLRLDLLSQRYRIILSFREDFLPEVRTWEPKVPSLLRNCLRLDPMSRQRAIEAVEQAGNAVLCKGVAPCIVDFVGRLDQQGDVADPSSVTVEPVLLSLCCYQLNRRRKPGAQIDEALVLEAGQDILDGFYREALEDEAAKGPPEVASFIEGYLIQGDHFRGDYPRNGALDEKLITEKQLAVLTDKHRLLRIVPYPDTTRVELIHDRLVPVVRKARDERKIKQHQDEQERLAREAQADRDKERARSEELQRERDTARRSLRLARVMRNIAMAAVIVAVALAIDSILARNKAELAQSNAVVAQVNAEHAREVAQNERAEAIWHRQTATSERMLDGRIPGGNLRATLQSVAALRYKSENDSQSAVLASLVFSPHTRQIIDLSSMRPTPALAYSPDGMRIAVGGDDGSVLLLDAMTGKTLGPKLTGLPGAVWSLSFSGDSTRLIIGMADSENPDSTEKKRNADGVLRVWDLTQPKPVMLLKGHSGSVYSVAYSKKSDLVASAGSDNTLRVWDAVRGHELWHKTCADKSSCDNYMIAVAISPDGTVVASGGGDAIVRLWDAQTGKLLGSLKGHINLVQFVEFSPDGKRIGSASDDFTARVWDIKTGKQIKVAEDHKGSVFSLSFSPDGEMLATASSDGKVRLFWINDDKNLKAGLVRDGELKGHLEIVYAVAFSKDGQSLISTGLDGTLRLWGPKTEGASVAQINHTQAVTSVAVSPDGKLIASGSGDGTLQTWDTPSLDEPSTVTEVRKSIPDAHRGEIHTLSFNADGTQLLSGGADNTVRFWSAATGQSLRPALRGHTAAVRAVAWGANDQVISAAEDGVIRVWNAKSREAVIVIPPPEDLPKDYKYNVWSIAVDPRGRYIAAGGSDGWLRLWNTSDGKELQSPLVGHTASIFAVAVSRDGTMIATGGADGGVLFWKATSSKDGIKVKLHARSRELSAEHIYGIAFSADGKLVASSGKDKLLRLWNPEDGTRVGIPLAGHADLVTSVAFSSLGNFIVSAGHDRKLLLWLGPQHWVKALCSRLTQNMSQKQWREWVSPDIEYHEQCPGLPIPPDPPAEPPTTAATGETK